MNEGIAKKRSQTLPLSKDKPKLPPRPSSVIMLDLAVHKNVPPPKDTSAVTELNPPSTDVLIEDEGDSVKEMNISERDNSSTGNKKIENSNTIETANTSIVQEKSNNSESTSSNGKVLKPAPSRPPPPLTRPPRPYPPRPYPPPQISEASLAKKRPPPTPPLVIDSRASPKHFPHSHRTLKTPSPKDNAPPRVPSVDTGEDDVVVDDDLPERKQNLHEGTSPSRPPPPVTASLNISEDSVVNEKTKDEKNPKEDKDKAKVGEKRTSFGTVSVVDDTVSATPEASNSSNVLGKVKETFRSFSTRRIKTVRGSNSSSSGHNWKRVFSSRHATRESTNSNPLTEDSRYPETLSTGIVDPVLIQCVAYLNREDILKEPGLFRIPGDLSIIKQLRSRFIAGEEVDLFEILDPNVISGLLKIYYRERVTPLISDRQCIGRINTSVRNKDIQSFIEVLNDLDDATVASLRMLSELFKKITSYSDLNHMTSGTLATSCGPSFFPNIAPSNANALIKFLSDHCDEIF